MTSAYHHNLKLIDTPSGKGISTSADIEPNTVLFEFKGDIHTRKTLNVDSPYYLQIGEDKYLGPSGDLDDYINHSCNPNCYLYIVSNRAFLKSLYLIKSGSEITFDYSTSSTESSDEWTMKCNCNTVGCRKNISGYNSLSAEQKKTYEELRMIPSYLKEK